MLQSLSSQLSSLHDNILVIDNPEKLDIKNIRDGVLIVYAIWSGPAIDNLAQTIRLLNDQNHSGQIIIIDIDCMTPDFQSKMFGQVCHGWGEIFPILNGQIRETFVGKNCFDNFKVYNQGR